VCKECGCGVHHYERERFHVRRFLTRDEKVKKLKVYVEELKKELAAVEERINELRSQ